MIHNRNERVLTVSLDITFDKNSDVSKALNEKMIQNEN